MRLSRPFQMLVLFGFVLAVAGAQSVERSEESARDAFVPVFSVDAYGAAWILGDTDNNGEHDYALMVDDMNRKRYEAIDFNRDGLMDDFYIYEGGVLVSEQLDTNFDGAIDLWIHMHDGARIRGYERDTDYDGEVDVVKEFGGN